MGGFDEAKQDVESKLTRLRDLKNYGDYKTNKEEMLLEWFLTVLGDLHHAWCAEAQKKVKDELEKFPKEYDDGAGTIWYDVTEVNCWIEAFEEKFEKAEKLLETASK